MANARGLTTPDGTVLTGNGISIGQIEVFRPGTFGVDTDANKYHPDVRLYLMPEGATQLSDAVWVSRAPGNVQHIFFQLPPGDADYEIWVENTGNNSSNSVTANYGLAWWA